jgi:hypothetical protein
MYQIIHQLFKFKRMICNYCNDCADICNCGCKVTTTTTCIPVAEKPCMIYCDDLLLSECIVYDGPDLSCYGVNNGDTLEKILNLVIEKINLDASSCSYGNAAMIERITTTTTTAAPTTTTSTTSTTSTSTTTTTTLPPVPLCFAMSGEAGFSCFNENKQMTPTSNIINGKVSYSIEGEDLIVKWSIANNRWELHTTLAPIELVAYLQTTNNDPVGPLLLNEENLVSLNLTWQYPEDYLNIRVTTRYTCPSPLCVTITNGDEINGLYQVKSFFDTLDNYPGPSVITKPYYFSCTEVSPSFTIIWNSFTNVYELFVNDIKIAYTNVSNIETLNYITWINFPMTDYSAAIIKSKAGNCPIVEL